MPKTYLLVLFDAEEALSKPVDDALVREEPEDFLLGSSSSSKPSYFGMRPRSARSKFGP